MHFLLELYAHTLEKDSEYYSYELDLFSINGILELRLLLLD